MYVIRRKYSLTLTTSTNSYSISVSETNKDYLNNIKIRMLLYLINALENKYGAN